MTIRAIHKRYSRAYRAVVYSPNPTDKQWDEFNAVAVEYQEARRKESLRKDSNRWKGS